MHPQDNRILAAYLAEQAADPSIRPAVTLELRRAVRWLGRDRFQTERKIRDYAREVEARGQVSVLPEEIAAVLERARARHAAGTGAICEACLEAGSGAPRTSPVETMPATRFRTHWALWQALESGDKLWICPDCWGRRRHAELETLLGTPAKIEQERETLVSPAFRDVTMVQEGEQGFSTLPEFIAAIETHPTRIPSTSPETQEDAVLDRGRVTTARYGGETTEEMCRRYPDTVIIRELGKGVTSTVYEVERPSSGKRHALKGLKIEFVHATAMRARFVREAEATMRLKHPNIVQLVEFQNLSNVLCLLMELVDGVTLHSVISRGALGRARALEIAEQICSGLAHAHKQKIVHRDIKPENIFLSHDGKVKIGDFGLAKLSESMHGVRPLTAQGGLMGTPGYMAPEQRESAHDVDGRADIYSLGIMLHEMLTGRLPREPAPGQAVELEPVDPKIDPILAIATATDPDERYALAEDFKNALMSVRLGL